MLLEGMARHRPGRAVAVSFAFVLLSATACARSTTRPAAASDAGPPDLGAPGDGGDPSSDGGSGVVDAGPLGEVPRAQELVDAVTSAFFNYLSRCRPSPVGTVGRFLDGLVDDVRNGTAVLHPEAEDRARRYIASLEGQRCALVLLGPLEPLTIGTVPVGDLCSHRRQCGDGADCRARPGACGAVCVSAAGEGDRCGILEVGDPAVRCRARLYCDEALAAFEERAPVCRPLGGAGAPCVNAWQCEPGLACLAPTPSGACGFPDADLGVCVTPILGDEGASCTTDGACGDAPVVCPYGADLGACPPGGRCPPGVAIGEPCGPCAEGFCTGGVCVDHIAAGASCPAGDRPCVAGTRCEGGRCRVLPRYAQPCDGACAETRFPIACVAGVCRRDDDRGPIALTEGDECITEWDARCPEGTRCVDTGLGSPLVSGLVYRCLATRCPD